jgi:hypothetical protein
MLYLPPHLHLILLELLRNVLRTLHIRKTNKLIDLALIHRRQIVLRSIRQSQRIRLLALFANSISRLLAIDETIAHRLIPIRAVNANRASVATVHVHIRDLGVGAIREPVAARLDVPVVWECTEAG